MSGPAGDLCLWLTGGPCRGEARAGTCRGEGWALCACAALLTGVLMVMSVKPGCGGCDGGWAWLSEVALDLGEADNWSNMESPLL